MSARATVPVERPSSRRPTREMTAAEMRALRGLCADGAEQQTANEARGDGYQQGYQDGLREALRLLQACREFFPERQMDELEQALVDEQWSERR